MSFAEIRSNSFGSVISENNSTNFYIKLIGVHEELSEEQRSLSGIFVNNVKVSSAPARGINIVKFDDNMKVLEQVRYDLYSSPTTDGYRFVEYVKASTNLLALFTFDAIGNTEEINELMTKLGSSVWPTWLLASAGTDVYSSTTNRRFAYTALIDGKTQNIITEATGSKTSGFPARTEYALDAVSDLGSIGMGKSLIEESTEYSGKNYSVHTYQSKASVSVFPQISSGEWLSLRADIKLDQEAMDNKVEARLLVQFYDSTGSFLPSVMIRTMSGLEYQTFEQTIQIPPGIAQVDIGVYHAPQSLDGKGTVWFKNVVIQPSNAPVKKNKPGRLGRFTAPTDKFKEGPIENQPNTVVKFTNDDQIEASELQELDTDGYWVKLLDHNTLNKGEVFASAEDVQFSLVPYLYSNMASVEDYRGFNGKFKFRLDYETERGYIEWEQSSSPNESVAKDVKIITNKLVDTMKTFTGIALSTSTMDTVYDCDSSGEWFYAVGALHKYKTGIPANNNTESHHVRFSVWKD